MTRWATGRGIFDHDPLAALNSPATVKARDRVLSEHEIATLWHRLPEVFQRPATRLALMLILVAGQRPGEVAGMAKTEIDLAARLWRLPAERSKNKRPHDIPLSDTAIAIIREAIEASGENPHVFPMRDGRPMDSNNLGERVRDTQACFGLANWTPHDLRRTALTHMGKLGISPLVRAHVANHRTVTKAGVTLGVYDHYDYGAEKRQALDLWAERLQAIIGGKGAEVIPMNTRA
jgi:integrase